MMEKGHYKCSEKQEKKIGEGAVAWNYQGRI